MKNSKTITIAVIIGVVAALTAMIAVGAFLCFNYFFHRTVTVQTEYDIPEITCYISDYGKKKTVTSKSFTHYAPYGRMEYCFDLYVDDRAIPVDISVFKTDNYKHDSVAILISQGNSDSELIVEVKAGYPNPSWKYSLPETDKIEISLGP